MSTHVIGDHGRSISLEAIVDRVAPLAVLHGSPGTVITDVVFDHREVRSGSLFCCIVGAHADGHHFAHQAAQAGAVAFICEHSLAEEGIEGAQLVVEPGQVRIAMGEAACALFGDPSRSLRCIGVTGTNGKTTTTHLIRAILNANQWQTGVLGTLDGARTTPEAPQLQRHLARYLESGCVAVALEVSSHALAQQRVKGMQFAVGVFTNLTQDHLDFHGNMEEYFRAKSLLFTQELSTCGVVNADDAYGRRLLEHATIPLTAFALSDAVDLVLGVEGSTFVYEGYPVSLALGGLFNVSNALAAAASARALGISPEVIANGLSSATPVPGRFESIEADGVRVIVDYAHTPHGLEEVLRAARAALAAEHADGRSPLSEGGRLLVVFGAGGERDRSKRPVMGRVASELADAVVITSDNPRSEDPEAIIAEIAAGVPTGARCIHEPDRRRAIALAISQTRPGDLLVVAGKGHETMQQFADRTTHFDDREVVREELARSGLNHQNNSRHRP